MEGVNKLNGRNRGYEYCRLTICDISEWTSGDSSNTGAILIDCLYDENDAGERVRIRSNYKQLGEACFTRFGGTITHTVQLLDLFLSASLYLVLCASLATGIFPDLPLSDKLSMFITATAVLPTLFLKNFSRVAWLSLISVIAIFIAVVAVLVYGIAHHSSWNPGSILVWDIEGAPVSLAIISYMYLCHTTLPGLEASRKIAQCSDSDTCSLPLLR